MTKTPFSWSGFTLLLLMATSRTIGAFTVFSLRRTLLSTNTKPSLHTRLHLPTARNMSAESSSSTDTTIDIATNLQNVQNRITQVATADTPVRLVAVSKTKPIALLQAAYDAGCRVFGENYVQELVEKVPQLPNDVQWHYIGALQSNKVNLLLRPFLNSDDNSIQQLTLETVGSIKLATKLNNALQESSSSSSPSDRTLLKVFVQVNTSGEDSKSGVSPGDECVELCQHIATQCPNLQLVGLMTIGAVGDASCFDVLKQCRTLVAESVESPLELSMGMSGDFEQAIQAGATNVRVGSTIFGARDYSNKK